MKCRFCSFTVPQEITRRYKNHATTNPPSFLVVESGWRALQLHCQEEHKQEPAVKELLFSDAPLLNYLEAVISNRNDKIKVQGSGADLFIETEDEE